MRALLPIRDLSTLFPVTPIVLDLTSASMFHQIQSPKFMQVALATLGHKIQTNPVGTPLKPVRTPVAIFGSLGVCIFGPASRHWLISYSPIHLT